MHEMDLFIIYLLFIYIHSDPAAKICSYAEKGNCIGQRFSTAEVQNRLNFLKFPGFRRFPLNTILLCFPKHAAMISVIYHVLVLSDMILAMLGQ